MTESNVEDPLREILALQRQQLEVSQALLAQAADSAQRQAQAIRHQEESIGLQRHATRRLLRVVTPFLVVIFTLMIACLVLILQRIA